MIIDVKSNFKKIPFSSASALKEGLAKNYSGQSVSLGIPLPSGIVKNVFVDIQADGSCIDTYSRERVDIEKLFN